MIPIWARILGIHNAINEVRPNSGKPINNASREMCPTFGGSKISRWLKTLVHFYFYFIFFSILVDLA